ncbi:MULTISPECIES: hypothetical protein [unclassified Bradyrhizobium]|uniref:hypothetical protein n=1 Tax=unclassified Bradyrhizobium TaxID=2631580 RepID=UPI0028E5F8C3|nr:MULTISPECIES: hypothetical protein [unclassified Bradyrhizobium]
MLNPSLLTDANACRWNKAKPVRDFVSVAQRMVAKKARYQAVEKVTRVPWPVIAVIHERECSQSWGGSLAQGDPWNKVSVHVPAGRGPFGSWEEAAVDALVNCPPHAARWKDWSVAGALTLLEQYNGLGYARRGVPSPYVWAGTNQYRAGKYVRDGVYDPVAVDRQLGCAGLLMAMMGLDPSITFPPSETASVRPHSSADPPPISPQISISNPAKGSIGAFFVALMKSIFGRRTT